MKDKKKKKKKNNEPINKTVFRIGNYTLSVIKTNIKNIIKSKTFLNKINDTVIKVNKIIIHTYNYLKLYLLHLYETNQEFPILDDSFIRMIIKVLCLVSNY